MNNNSDLNINLAKGIHFFLDTYNNEKNDLRKFDTWYSTDILKYFTHLLPKSVDVFRYVFTNMGASDSQEAFEKQFIGLCYLSQALEKAVFFIGVQSPTNQNYFIFGLIMNDMLLIINPIGQTKQTEFYTYIEKIKFRANLKYIYQSNFKFQKDSQGLYSCGPICVELMRHISSIPFKDLLKKFGEWEYLSERGLITPVDVAELLPGSLKELLNFTDEEEYKQNILMVRSSHLNILKVTNFTLDKNWDDLITVDEQQIFLNYQIA